MRLEVSNVRSIYCPRCDKRVETEVTEAACSMSGLVYARAPRGPIVDGYEALFGEMVRQGYLVEEQVTTRRSPAPPSEK